jgi:hypothetical protein
MSAIQSMKLAIVSATGLSKDALHVYVGLAVFLIVALIGKSPRTSWKPLLAVLVVAVCGELLDMVDDLTSLGRWRWHASLHDIANTCFWPGVLSMLSRLKPGTV